jgi:hypothetical protein
MGVTLQSAVCLSFLYASYPGALIALAVRKAYTCINKKKLRTGKHHFTTP